MDLFEVRNGYAFPSIHALLIEPFKSMWEKDTSDKKENCIRDFTYIELVCSPKKSNVFYGYDEAVRSEKVKEKVYNDPEYELDDIVILAVMEYKNLLLIASPTYGLLNSSLKAANKLKDFLDDFDLSERTPSGMMILKPADITKALKEIPDVSKSLTLAREKVNSELVEDTKNRNNRELGEFET